MSLSLAIVFPAVLFLVLLVVQASLWWYAAQAALTAAREGTEAGRVRGGTPQAADRRARDFLDRLGTLAEPVGIDSGASDANTFRLTVTIRTQSVVPGFDHLLISEHVSAPRETFVPQGAP